MYKKEEICMDKLLMEDCLCTRYTIIQKLGCGGMGSVYLARSHEDGIKYAVKLILNNEQSDGRKEAEIMCGLSHHMLPVIKEFFVYENYSIIVMEYISGDNMQDYIKNNGPVSEKMAISCLRQLADVLMYLHSQKPPVIYRDLKPSNIMVENGNVLRLIDFGIARKFRRASERDNDTLTMGTPGYAAPEQLTGTSQTDARTDIYSLGATMYYIVTGADIGKPPFEAMPLHTLRPDMKGPLGDIILRCLQRNPQSRYQSVSDILSELDEKLYAVKTPKKRRLPPVNIMITHSKKTNMFQNDTTTK